MLLGTIIGAGCVKEIQPGDPLPGLNRAERNLFESGRAVFGRTFVPETGLGPLFNSTSCGECHEDPSAGGTGDEMEVHVSSFLSMGSCDLLAGQGGPVIQQSVTPALKAAFGIESEPLPSGTFQSALRTTPDLFGFGLLDAVPDSEILAGADPDDRNGDGISGRPNRFIDGRLGRFGRKAFIPTLREFNSGAFVLEQGITTPAIPVEETVGGKPIPAGVDPVPEPEIDQAAFDAADAFVRFLAPPARGKRSRTAGKGEGVFARIGCHGCHRPCLKTGSNPVGALSKKEIAAYTDLLLHDMGPDLADICLGDASPSEFRTEPLMGLRLMARFLHDGRAATIEDAIELHGGEAAAARDRFRSLSEGDRSALIEFLKSL